MTSAAAGGRLTTPVYHPNTRLFARHTPLAAHSPMCRPAGRPSGSSRSPPPDSVLWADRVGSRRPWATTRSPSCPMPIASDLHHALWATFVVQAASRSPALPPPRPRSRAGVLGGVTAGAAVLSYGVQVILDEGVDDESVCRRSDGSDWKAAGATSGRR